MRLPKLSFNALGILSWSCVVACATLATVVDGVAQGLPQPPVGGYGTFGGGGGQPGAQGGAARQRLSPLGAVPVDFATLKLAPGFLIFMDVYDTPEYSIELRLDSNGDVNIPIAGMVHLSDMTLVEAGNRIATALKDGKILTNPQVNLNIEEYAGRDVTVLGEVRAPGRIELLAPRHLDDVLALAGGQTEVAGNAIEIRHEAGVTQPVDVIHFSPTADNHVLHDTVVLPGDTITVKRAGVVYVLGAVTRPGGYVMQEGGELDVIEALSLAYGTTISAAVNNIRLIHKTPDGGVQESHVDYRDIVKGKAAPPRLQAEDVLYVPLSKVKVFLTQGLLQSTSQAAIYVYH